jgi:hypothetical protein
MRLELAEAEVSWWQVHNGKLRKEEVRTDQRHREALNAANARADRAEANLSKYKRIGAVLVTLLILLVVL